MKPIKDLVLYMYETYLHLDSNGYKDYSILINAYEYSIAGLVLEKKDADFIYIDKLNESLIKFYKLCIGNDNASADNIRYEFNNSFIKVYESKIKLMEITINKFLHQNYNFSEEDLIKQTKVDIDHNKGIFGIDIDVI